MSKMVTARVPDALYEQGCIQLKRLGASTTDLVKAAFDFLLKEHALPSAPNKTGAAQPRKLPKEERARLEKLFTSYCVDLNISSSVADDKQAIREVRTAKYESFA